MRREKIMQSVRARTSLALMAAVGLATLGVGNAPALSSPSATYAVTLDTTSLTTNANYTGPFVLDFQFIDGDGSLGSPNVNNTVTVTGFSGGSNFSQTNFVLSDGDPAATPATGIMQIAFQPGSTLNFLATLTTNQDAMQPDAFSVGILQKYGSPNAADIATQDSSGNDAFGSFATFTESSDSSNPTALNIATFDNAAGDFTPTVTPAPEPAGAVTWLVGVFAMGTLLATRRPRRVRVRIRHTDNV